LNDLNLLGNKDAARRRELSLGVVVGDGFVASEVVSRALSRGSDTVALGGITLDLLTRWGRDVNIGAIRVGC
jgi:hypothetical protein